MFDYKLIEALAKVIECGGFERAARVLFITQSAVSQRIRQLEEKSGQILLSRTTPPEPTLAGRSLLKHYQQVKLLEEGLSAELGIEPTAGPTTLAIGINADSLASWFLNAISPLLADGELLIDLRIDDQEQTHRYLREGEVVGCISTEPAAMQGCRVEPLGRMNYRLLATAKFVSRWFSQGLSTAAVESAPSVIFNHKDRLHQRYLGLVLGGDPQRWMAHYIPTPEQFLQAIADGYAYGMVPDWQSAVLLQSGELVELVPGREFPVDLYWHCWNLESPPLQTFSRQLVCAARQLLAV